MFDAPDEVAKSREAQPEGFNAGFAVALASEEAAEHGDLPNHLAEAGRCAGRFFLCQNVGPFPFLLAEQFAGGQVWMGAPQSNEACKAPRHHHVNCQASSILSICPSCRASTRQPFLRILKKISISHRTRYQSINVTASSKVLALRLVSKRHSMGLTPFGGAISWAMTQVTLSRPHWPSGNSTRQAKSF